MGIARADGDGRGGDNSGQKQIRYTKVVKEMSCMIVESQMAR